MRFDIPAGTEFDRDRTERVRESFENIYRAVEFIKSIQQKYIALPSRNIGLTGSEKLDLLMQGIAYRLSALADGGIHAWNDGHLLPSVLCARAILETVSSTSDMIDRTRKYVDNQNFDTLKKLLLGQMMHWQHMMKKQNITPMPSMGTLVDRFANKAFGKNKKDFLDVYGDFSQIIHPNWLGTLGFFSVLNEAEQRQVFTPGGARPAWVLADIRIAFSLLEYFEQFFNEVTSLKIAIGRRG